MQVQHVTGVDLSPRMLGEAAAKVAHLTLQDSVSLREGKSALSDLLLRGLPGAEHFIVAR